MSKRLIHSFIYLGCFCGMAFLSCKKMDTGDHTPIIPGELFPIPAASPVNGALSGRVLNENNAPVSSAAIECAGIITNTDVNGFFNINQVTLDKYISTVTVTKTGYFKAYRSFSANTGRNFVDIKLIPKVLTATVSSVSPVTVILPNSTEIRLQPNSIIVKSTGVAYNGSVNVYASYIDPTRTDIGSVVPGSFIGKDNNNMYALQSTGMIAVDIESASGEPLQLAVNMPASIKLPIPASLAGNAPSTIDTWSLDDKGVWKKEATANRSGNFYDMPVTHFSFWNCDVPMNAVYLSMHVQDLQGNSLSNHLVQLTALNTAGLGMANDFTDNNGNVSGLVPAGVQMHMNIYPGAFICINAPVYSQNIGPYVTNTTLTISISISSSIELLSVSGVANDCTGNPIQHGTVLVYTNQFYHYASITNGIYNTTLTHCDPISSVNIFLWDDSSNIQGSAGPILVSGNSVTIPAVSLCAIPLNIYDGIYEVTGSYYDVTNTAFTGTYPKQCHVITKGPAAVIISDPQLDFPGFLFLNNGTSTYYGSFGLDVFFNTTSNNITAVHNYYGDPLNLPTAGGNPALGSGAPLFAAANTRTAVLDPTGINTYNPVTRTIKIKYMMNQPSVVPSGSRAFFDETWTYIGPR